MQDKKPKSTNYSILTPTIVKNRTWLITIDLDGTLLKTPPKNSKNPNYDINTENVNVLKKLIEKGHKIAIVTGRPWRDTESIYRKVGLHTIVANFNGSLIHDPNDTGFLPYSSSMNRKYFPELINKTSLKRYVVNFIIECHNSTYILDNEDIDMLNRFHIINDHNLIKVNSDFDLPVNPQSIIFKLNKRKLNEFNEYIILTELKRIYGEAFLFRYWYAPGTEFIYLEVNAKSITKASALKFIASYYNIPISNTIAFGDGENDIEMLETANIGVAMKNATDVVKSHSKDVTNKTNDNAGVGDYLKDFFKL